MSQPVLQQSTLTTLQQFMKVVLKNLKLQEKLKITNDQESFVRLLVALGKESDYCFSTEDVEVMLQDREMASLAKPIWERAISQLRSEQSRGGW